jgi:hypothetical protein
MYESECMNGVVTAKGAESRGYRINENNESWMKDTEYFGYCMNVFSMERKMVLKWDGTRYNRLLPLGKEKDSCFARLLELFIHTLRIWIQTLCWPWFYLYRITVCCWLHCLKDFCLTLHSFIVSTFFSKLEFPPFKSISFAPGWQIVGALTYYSEKQAQGYSVNC